MKESAEENVVEQLAEIAKDPNLIIISEQSYNWADLESLFGNDKRSIEKENQR